LILKRQHSLLGVLNVKLIYMPNGVRPEVGLTPDQRILCCDSCEKCFMPSSCSHLVFCTA